MILKEQRNCWKIRRANRFALLIDGAAYFSALHETMFKAHESVMLVGWDFHSRVALLRDENGPDKDSVLRVVLDHIADQSPALQIHVLSWDYAMLYALEREPLAVFNFAWRSHPRVHFHMDSEHPIGASHHQKIAVLDDSLGFVGGLDITQRRWDTSKHLEEDPRREDPAGERYGPFHDVQGMVDGEAARALGQLSRRRWFYATGKRLAAPQTDSSLWPTDLEPELRDIAVGIARTEPRYKGRAEVREIEQLYMDAIAAATRRIYIENQYLTASRVVDALVERMSAEDPPELVVVLPDRCTGWLEEQVMNTLRARAVIRLRETDGGDRFRVCYPSICKSGQPATKVHSKLMLVDDVFVTMGSGNLSNRSMGLDTECNLALEAETPENRTGVDGLLHRLLADHLGRETHEVRQAMEEEGSMIAAIDRLNTGDHCLVFLGEELEQALDEVPPDLEDLARRLDPEQPVGLDIFLDEVTEESPEVERGPGQLSIALTILAVSALVVLWRHSPLGGQEAAFTVAHWVGALRSQPLTPAVLLAAFTLCSLVPFPVTLLIGVSAFLFPPVQAIGYTLAGCLLGALAGYLTGRIKGTSFVRQRARPGLNRLSRLLSAKTFSSVLLARLLPITTFGLVNMVAGAAHISPWRFFGATIMGMAPGVAAVTLYAEGLRQTLITPSWGDAALLLGGAASIAGAMVLLRRRLQRPSASEEGQTENEGEGET